MKCNLLDTAVMDSLERAITNEQGIHPSSTAGVIFKQLKHAHRVCLTYIW